MNEQGKAKSDHREQLMDALIAALKLAMAFGLSEEDVGIAISVACRWDVFQIAHIGMYALEDSNWHSLARVIDEAIKNELDA